MKSAVRRATGTPQLFPMEGQRGARETTTHFHNYPAPSSFPLIPPPFFPSPHLYRRDMEGRPGTPPPSPPRPARIYTTTTCPCGTGANTVSHKPTTRPN